MKRTPFVHISLIAVFLFYTINPTFAQGNAQSFQLPKPGSMVHLSPPMNLPVLKGLKVDTNNPFRFDFIIDKGDSVGNGRDHSLRDESTKLIKYFLASLTVPENDVWVNLSPYEKDRIVPESFGITEMGRDVLAQDYMLKQVTASLIYPEDEVGRKFWKRVYEEAAKKYGNTSIPVNTFNKVWIVPEKAVVYENSKAGTAYVVESKLKVMLETDYLSLEKNSVGVESPDPMRKGGVTPPVREANQIGSQIVREIIIPELTKEVNEGKNFAQLRQVYSSLILATWYKKKVKDSLLAKVYTDKNKVKGINLDDPQEKQKIYQQYLQAFKKGVYNYIKEDLDPVTHERIPRKYFSGGFSANKFGDLAMLVSADEGMLSGANVENDVVVSAAIQVAGAVSARGVALGGLFASDLPKDFKGVYLRRGAEYGSQWNWLNSKPYSVEGYSHRGIDIFEYTDGQGLVKDIPLGTSLGSLVEGVVVQGLDVDYPSGDEVIIQTKTGKLVRYGHIQPLVAVGERVVKGQLIAKLNPSPQDSRSKPHLHLEVMSAKTEIKTSSPRKDFARELDYERALIAWLKELSAVSAAVDPLVEFPEVAQSLKAENETKDKAMMIRQAFDIRIPGEGEGGSGGSTKMVTHALDINGPNLYKLTGGIIQQLFRTWKSYGADTFVTLNSDIYKVEEEFESNMSFVFKIESLPEPGKKFIIKMFGSNLMSIMRISQSDIQRLFDRYYGDKPTGNDERISRLFARPAAENREDFEKMAWRSYMFMTEFVDGEQLSKVTDSQQRFKYLMKAIEEIAYAHNSGLFHGDLTSNNIIITPSGDIKLIDWDSLRCLVEKPADVRTVRLSNKYRDIESVGKLLISVFSPTGAVSGVEDTNIYMQESFPDDQDASHYAKGYVSGLNPATPAINKVITKAVLADRQSHYESLDDLLTELKAALIEDKVSFEQTADVSAAAETGNEKVDNAMIGSSIFRRLAGRKVFDREYLRSKIVQFTASIMTPEGYQLLGGDNNLELAADLEQATGKPGIFLRLDDVYRLEEDTMEFMRIIRLYVEKKVQAQKFLQAKEPFRILVVGAGTGIDALTAFHQAKKRGLQVQMDAVDINHARIRNAEINLNLLNDEKKEGDQIRVLKVKEDGLLDEESIKDRKYDLILFNAPDAVSKDKLVGYSSNIRMDKNVFETILDSIQRHLSDDGYAIVGNQREAIVSVMPKGFKWNVLSGDESRFDMHFEGLVELNRQDQTKVFLGLYRDRAQLSKDVGGIDFNADKINLQIQHSGQGIKFKMDPAVLSELEKAPGFTPVIINIKPLENLRLFLGLSGSAGGANV